MSRSSKDIFDEAGQLLHGFDYDLQCWVKGGRVLDCGHPAGSDCGCSGREFQGRRLEEVRQELGLEEVSGVYQGMKEEGLIQEG